MASTIKSTSGHRCCIDVETRYRHDVDVMSTNKYDVFETTYHRRCLDVETRLRQDVEITLTTKTDVVPTSDHRRCIDVEMGLDLGTTSLCDFDVGTTSTNDVDQTFICTLFSTSGTGVGTTSLWTSTQRRI